MKLFFVDEQINTGLYYNFVEYYLAKSYPRRLTMYKRYHIYIIDAYKGVSWCLKELDRIANIYEGDENNEAVIITNSTDLLNCVKYTNIYLFGFKSDDFLKELDKIQGNCKEILENLYRKYCNCRRIKCIDELGDKEIRISSNIRNLYLAGEFKHVYSDNRKGDKY